MVTLLNFRLCDALLMIIYDECSSFINVLYISIILDHIGKLFFFLCFINDFIINSLLIILQQKIYVCVNVLYSPVNMFKDFLTMSRHIDLE